MTTPKRRVILSAISESTSFDELGRRIVETLAKEFDAEVCTIWRRYQDDQGLPGLRLLAASAKAPQTLAQEVTYRIYENVSDKVQIDGVTGYVAQTRKEVHVSSFPQLKEEYGFCWKGRLDKSQWDADPGKHFRSLVALPLVLGDRLVGVLKLENKRDSPGGFPELDRKELHELVPDISLAVHSFSLLEPHEKRLIGVPAKMVEALLGPYETKELVSEIVKTVAEGLHAEICSLWLVDANEKELRLADGYGFSTEARSEVTYSLTSAYAADRDIEGITAWVAVRKQPFWANSWPELKAHPSWKGKWDPPMWGQRNESFRCLYAIPLVRQDEVIGVLKVENRKGAAFFTERDKALCDIMASLIVLVLDLGQQLRTALISDFAHLIRSPIGQVPMNLSGLEREIRKIANGEKPNLERIEQYLTFIKRALLAATMTSRTLVAFAQRGSATVAGPRKIEVGFADLVKGRLDELQPLLHSGITLEPDFPDNLLNLSVVLDETDRTRVQIAIDNILHNAIKYSREGGRVIVALSKSATFAILTIEDFGPGIVEDDLPRIFEPGFTRRSPGHPQGTGMGLATVKQSLERLGWKIDVFSRLGRGTTFKVAIPIGGEATVNKL
ncbi:MAG: GAF domain-containing sensor histidine kinase [Deltaproteobacteria bacterium]|nr:GAF domain-containing sensor histidine kinase [Deltaproteobacteria bacterium]